ncbi:hypothetical protein ACOSQ2_012551 [Xanthoceras sorbifolium]|uniref:Phototropic-responsive NPH3 family protein n=1 Tax=Xanthoceras sorbifolium TaxID=99658 RepID=A0ABQ8HXF8_9ROSI|nr:hypothetical protein JRO89_XS06G0093600 [Xanthoceras sorbifolium]
MQVCCDLEVDVNGQQIFMVDKRILASCSGRFRNLFSKSNGSTTGKLKVIFHDFPGGAEGFELIARFCYSNGKTDEITASNIVLLSSAAHFMEMGFDGDGKLNLTYQIEKSLEEIDSWSWSELLLALKLCQDLLLTADTKFILEKVLVCLIERLALPGVASPCTPFSDHSSKFSCDTRSADSMKTYSQKTWWFEDFLFLNVDLIDKVINMMVLHNFDHDTICKFLFYYYQRSRFLGASPAEKCRITEVVINLLSLLDRTSLPCKALFYIFRATSSLKLGKYYNNKLESLIGSQLDQATVDYLLVPSSPGKGYSYDVSLVLRLVKAFLFESSSWLSTSRLNKVASLMDSYLAEVSPDPHLKPSKFAALLMVLPDSTRPSHDGLYRAIDMYLEVHAELPEEEKMRVCRALNYEKLSTDALKHLSLNYKFPSRLAVFQSFINRPSKIKSLLSNTHHIVTCNNSLDAKEYIGEKPNAGKLLLYAKKHNLSTETDKFEAQLQGMQWRVVQMDKICRIMQTQMGNVTKPRLSSSGNARSLPKLCS